MTKADFHSLITDPATGPKLDAMLEADARLDAELQAELEVIRQRAFQDEQVARYLRSAWRAEGQREV